MKRCAFGSLSMGVGFILRATGQLVRVHVLDLPHMIHLSSAHTHALHPPAFF